MAWKQLIPLAAALVPTSALHRKSNGTADPCTCMTWKSFSQQGLRCPNPLFTPEAFTQVTRQLDEKAAGSERCTDLQTLDSNACINIDDQYAPDSWAENQWCYVSPECKSLNGGRKIANTKKEISWKVCGEGDQQLRNMAAQELMALSEAQKVPMHHLAALAYPKWQKHSWETLEPKILGPLGLKYSGFKSHMPAELQAMLDTGAGLLFQSDSVSTLPQYFAKDSKIYRISPFGFDPDGLVHELSDKYTQIDCVAFC